MLNLSRDQIRRDDMIDEIYIPKSYMPTTGFGEIKLIVKDGKIVDCKTTTSHKLIEELKKRKE